MHTSTALVRLFTWLIMATTNTSMHLAYGEQQGTAGRWFNRRGYNRRSMCHRTELRPRSCMPGMQDVEVWRCRCHCMMFQRRRCKWQHNRPDNFRILWLPPCGPCSGQARCKRRRRRPPSEMKPLMNWVGVCSGGLRKKRCNGWR